MEKFVRNLFPSHCGQFHWLDCHHFSSKDGRLKPFAKQAFPDVNLKRCYKRQYPPQAGTLCSKTAKSCFFGNQECPAGPYPTVKCFCSGVPSDYPYTPQTWYCEDVECPSAVPSTTPTADQCENVESTCPWTNWLDFDNPGGRGDYETFGVFAVRNVYPCGGLEPLAIECEAFRTRRGELVSPTIDAFATGETIVCNKCVGGYCINSEQADGKCDYDYRVRFQCPCGPTLPPTLAPTPTPPPTEVDDPVCTAADLGNFYISECEEKVVCEEYVTYPGGPTLYHYVPYREREEFTCMSAERRERFIKTYKECTTNGDLEELLSLHDDKDFGEIHITPSFLPWHRWYIMAVEDVLRKKDCRVTMPWWQWTRQSSNWYDDRVPPFHPGDDWLGTDGDPADGQCVVDGPFHKGAVPPWEPRQPERTTCLTRQFQKLRMPSMSHVNNFIGTIPITDFTSFTQCMEDWNIHGFVHWLIGGTVYRGRFPSKAPEFFLHHAHIDKIWDDWDVGASSSYTVQFPSFVDKDMKFTIPGKPRTPRYYLDLKKTGVIYVSTQSGPPGRLPAICGWVVTEDNNSDPLPTVVLELKLIDDGVNQLINDDTFASIRQRPLQVRTIEEMKDEFFSVQALASGLPEEIIEEELVRMRNATIAANDKLLAPTTVFEDDASTMLGFDVPAVVKLLNICPIGSTWDAANDRCSPVPADIQQLIDWTLGNSTVFLASVVSNADLAAPPSPVASTSPSRAPSFIDVKDITCRVLEDIDNDDVGEVAVPGVLIRLVDESDTVIRTTVTDTSGDCNMIFVDLGDLLPGRYYVVKETLPGYTDVSDSDGGNSSTISVTVAPDGSVSQEGGTFTVEEVSTISGGNVLEDTDSDGEGDVGLGDVPITLLSNSTTSP